MNRMLFYLGVIGAAGLAGRNKKNINLAGLGAIEKLTTNLYSYKGTWYEFDKHKINEVLSKPERGFKHISNILSVFEDKDPLIVFSKMDEYTKYPINYIFGYNNQKRLICVVYGEKEIKRIISAYPINPKKNKLWRRLKKKQ